MSRENGLPDSAPLTRQRDGGAGHTQMQSILILPCSHSLGRQYLPCYANQASNQKVDRLKNQRNQACRKENRREEGCARHR
jgi:hypothetical protein